MLIVLGHAGEPIGDRIGALRPGRFPVPVDLFPYTRAELTERAGSPIVAAARKSAWRYRRPA